MKFEKKKNDHGWRWIITDEDTHDKWSGNIERTIHQAKMSAIKAFIVDKEESIPRLKALIRQQKKSISALLTILDNEEKRRPVV